MSLGGLLVAALVAAGPVEVSEKRADRYSHALELGLGWNSRPTAYVLPDGPSGPVPSLGAGTEVSVLFRLRPLEASHPLFERASLGLGLAFSRWQQREGGADTAISLGVPLDLRFDLLTGGVRPWVGFQPLYYVFSGASADEQDPHFRFAVTSQLGLEVRASRALSLNLTAGYRPVDSAFSKTLEFRFARLGAGIEWRFDG